MATTLLQAAFQSGGINVNTPGFIDLGDSETRASMNAVNSLQAPTLPPFVRPSASRPLLSGYILDPQEFMANVLKKL